MWKGDDNIVMWRRFLWWVHGCSLDAVGVLVVYAWGLARLSGAAPPWYIFLFLGLGIWLGYVADRLVDVQRDPGRAQRSVRHAFHLRHRDRLRFIWWVVCFAMMVAGALDLPIGAFEGGGVVAVAAAVYVLWNGNRRRASRSLRSAFRKRLATVSLLTIAGAWWWPWWPGEDRLALVAGMGVFAVSAAWQIYLLHHHRRAAIPWTWRWKCTEGALAAALLGLAFLAGGAWAVPGAVFLAGSLLILGATTEGRDASLRALSADGALAVGWLLLGLLAGG